MKLLIYQEILAMRALRPCTDTLPGNLNCVSFLVVFENGHILLNLLYLNKSVVTDGLIIKRIKG